MSDALLRSRLIRLASQNPDFRGELLPLLAGDDEEEKEEVEEEESDDSDDDDDSDDEEEESDDEASKKKASVKLAARFRLLSPEDRHLAMGLVRLAQTMPEQKAKLMGLVTSSLREADWDPKQIAEKKSGPLQKQPDEGYLAGEFTQQEFSELREKQQAGQIPSVDKFASEAELRSSLIRLAHENPKLRAKLLPILTAGCEKLPAGPMRDNCEKKKEEGEKDD